MLDGSLAWGEVEQLLEDLVRHQQEQLLQCGRRIIPTLIPDDLLQPNDFPELEFHPYFRYEEGVTAGLQTAQMALRALRRRYTLYE